MGAGVGGQQVRWDCKSDRCVVAASDGSVLVVHALDSGRVGVVECRQQLHKACVMGVCWSQVHNVVASASKDGVCVLSQVAFSF